MQALKKVEIIIDYMELPRLLDRLQKEGLAVDYTVIKEAVGSGGRGKRTGDSFLGELTNSYLLIACSEAEARRIVEIVQPTLKRYGGICLVSNAMWVHH